MTVQDTAQQTPADRFRVGIDIGGTKIEAVLVDPQDNVRNDVRIPARRGNAQVIDDVVSITHEVAGDLFDQVATVGIGIPGQVNPGTGRVDNVVNLDIDTLELGAEAGKRLGIPVHVENDVNAAAVGAARMVGGSHPEGTIVFLNFGTGLAAGIVVDGVVQHGFRKLRQLLTEGAGIRKPGQKIRLYEKSKTLFFFYEAAPRDKIQAEKDEGHHKPRQDG